MRMHGLLLAVAAALPVHAAELRGTGDLGVIIEREAGSVLVVETSTDSILGRI